MKLIRNLAFVRVALVPLAVTKILLDRDDFPSQGYERAAWAVLGDLRRGSRSSCSSGCRIAGAAGCATSRR